MTVLITMKYLEYFFLFICHCEHLIKPIHETRGFIVNSNSDSDYILQVKSLDAAHMNEELCSC